MKYGELYNEFGDCVVFDANKLNPFILLTRSGIHYTMSETWENFNQEWSTPPLKDKDLVWCWDNDSYTSRFLAFYDAKHNACFDDDGDRNGTIWDNFEKYEGEWPAWAKEAVKTMKD